MEHFRRSGVNVAVLEAGLGGHIDSTNAVKSTCLSVVTSLALDHTHILGDTLEARLPFPCGLIVCIGFRTHAPITSRGSIHVLGLPGSS